MKLSYTVEEAARRLSLAFGEPLTDRDILQLVLYRKLPICVNFYQQLAIETAAVTMLWNWWPENVNDTTRLPEMLCANRGQRASTEETAEP